MTKKPPNRLYVDQALATGREVVLNEDQAHYAGRVRRLRPGDRLRLFNGDGGEFEATVESVARRRFVVAVGDYVALEAESPLRITLLQGISRGDRMDFVIQKATELGVHRISPVTTERSVVKLGPEKLEKRARHWARIAQSACEQCGRNRVPVIDEAADLPARLRAEECGQRLLLHRGSDKALGSIAPGTGAIELLIGPEGGLTEAERELASASGFTACTLGPRILRTETAAIAALAVLQSRAGDLGGG